MTQCKTIEEITQLANTIGVYIRDNKASLSDDRIAKLSNAMGYVLERAAALNEADAAVIRAMYDIRNKLAK
jgi:hypothetical protein